MFGLNKKFVFYCTILSIVLSACRKENSLPSLTLIGDDILEIRYDTSYTDPGAFAIDKEDGNLSDKIVSDWNSVVDLKKIGEYTVTYTVKDKKSKESFAKRKVIVKLKASNLFGEYNSNYTLNGYPDSDPFVSTIGNGNNENEFSIQPFGHPKLNILINLTGVLGTTLSIYFTTGSYFVEGVGTIENEGKNITINYRIVYQSSHISTGKQTLVRK